VTPPVWPRLATSKLFFVGTPAPFHGSSRHPDVPPISDHVLGSFLSTCTLGKCIPGFQVLNLTHLPESRGGSLGHTIKVRRIGSHGEETETCLVLVLESSLLRRGAGFSGLGAIVLALFSLFSDVDGCTTSRSFTGSRRSCFTRAPFIPPQKMPIIPLVAACQFIDTPTARQRQSSDGTGPCGADALFLPVLVFAPAFLPDRILYISSNAGSAFAVCGFFFVLDFASSQGILPRILIPPDRFLLSGPSCSHRAWRAAQVTPFYAFR